MSESFNNPPQNELNAAIPSDMGPTGHQPVASYIHTTIVVAIMLAVGYLSSLSAGKFQPGAAVSTYLTTIIFQWILFGIVFWGIKHRGVKANDILGRPWKKFDDFLIDLLIAGGFWFAYVLLAYIAAMVLTQGNPMNMKDAAKTVEGLAPRTLNQLGLWMVLSFTAGFVEEFVFRGYLQRQFTALTNRVWLGILIPSAIFLVGHLYQGERAIVPGVLGIFFGILAAWRRNLRPGIIAHVWQDALAGALMMYFTRHPELMNR